ncbi:UNKNOWN [Stylonychia lemnae]|uniref:Uncharacterized protein n=1 Tax=Stylonychia lemnae TaxID=5949 RepID=A0A078A781_STYLE|nr:UNKNOWN [Stylonychia lemnae]|eukprot:CDW78110.1 UNKNOWN [Stylonychia lemnae]
MASPNKKAKDPQNNDDNFDDFSPDIVIDDNHHRQNHLHVMDSDDIQLTWVEMIPQFLFLIVVAVVIIFAILDYQKVLLWLKSLIEWVQEDPAKAGFVIIGIYVCMIVLSIPITPVSIPIAYAFHKAFKNSYGRYLLRGTLKKTLLKRIKHFNALDLAITQEIQFKQFVLGNFGEMFHIFVWVFLGANLTQLDIFETDKSNETDSSSSSPFAKSLVYIEIIIAIVFSIYVSIWAKREFDKIVEQDNIQSFRSSDIEEGTPLINRRQFTGSDIDNQTNDDKDV